MKQLVLLITGIHFLFAQQQPSWVSEVPLQNIGPSVMSGRVTDLEVNPNATHEFYVGYASGGLWYTNNNGTSFIPILDSSPTQNIGDIAVDWKNKTIWVGTGENNASRSSYSGIGILKSTNQGQSWTHMGLHDAHHFGKIEINPNNPQEITVGVIGHLYTSNSKRGIYKTKDGGESWVQTLFINDTTGIIDISVSPDDFNIQYAAAWQKDRKAWHFEGSGERSGIYKSIDGGDHWELISTVESNFPQGKGVGRIGLAAFSDQTIYAILDNQNPRPTHSQQKNGIQKDDFQNMSLEAFFAIHDDVLETFLEENNFPKKYSAQKIKEEVKIGKLKPSDLSLYLQDANASLFNTPVIGAEVYRSDDGGISWSKTHSHFLDDIYFSYGYYFGQIHVSPVNDQHIYIYGVPLLKSKDGGKTFSSMNASNLHVDHHAFWINPKNPQHIINGNDGGINITYDDGAHWIKNNQPSVGQFYTVYADQQTPYHVYGGLQDNGVWVAPHNSIESPAWHQSGHYPWTSIMGGDGMQIQVDQRDANIVYTGYQFGNYFRIDRKLNKRKNIKPQHQLGEAPLRFNWQTPILLSSHNQDIIYLGSNKLHRSLNQGEVWETISSDLTKGGKVGNVPYGTLTTIDESKFQFGKLIIGTDDGHIQLTENGGSTWQNIANALPKDLWVSRVQFSTHHHNRIYTTLNGYRNDDFSPYVYVSDDDGVSWKPIHNQLEGAVNVIREDPVNDNILYVGTDTGLFVSFDQGSQWHAFQNNFPKVAVHDLYVQTTANDLLVGTHGRSIYKINLNELQALPKINKKDLHLFKLKNIKHNKRWGKARNLWSEPLLPKWDFVMYSATKKSVPIQVFCDDVLVYSNEIELTIGLNFSDYNLTIDKDRVQKFQRKIQILEPAENDFFYLPKGTYTLQVGESRQEFQIK